MPFPDELLTDNEHAIMVLRPHWTEVVAPLAWLGVLSCGGLVVLLLTAASPVAQAGQPTSGIPVGSVLLVLAVVAFVMLPLVVISRWLHWLSTRYAVTNHRVIMREGRLTRDDRDISLQVIQNVRVAQGLIARLAGAGNLELQTAATRGYAVLRWVPQVQEVRRLIHQLAQDSRREPA